jgi:hypothetical protein
MRLLSIDSIVGRRLGSVICTTYTSGMQRMHRLSDAQQLLGRFAMLMRWDEYAFLGGMMVWPRMLLHSSPQPCDEVVPEADRCGSSSSTSGAAVTSPLLPTPRLKPPYRVSDSMRAIEEEVLASLERMFPGSSDRGTASATDIPHDDGTSMPSAATPGMDLHPPPPPPPMEESERLLQSMAAYIKRRAGVSKQQAAREAVTRGRQPKVFDEWVAEHDEALRPFRRLIIDYGIDPERTISRHGSCRPASLFLWVFFLTLCSLNLGFHALCFRFKLPLSPPNTLQALSYGLGPPSGHAVRCAGHSARAEHALLLPR